MSLGISITELLTEDGIAPELMALGIDKRQIVLGFKSVERRQITDSAVA